MREDLLFDIGDSVKIPTLVIDGIVNGIYIDGNGVIFNVEYKDWQGAIHREYFTADRLEK